MENAMKILTRRVGESLIIETESGEQIELTILDTQGSRVRLSASSTKDLKIFREEELEPQRRAV